MSESRSSKPLPVGPCSECNGRGWHIGECHPREQCGACGAKGGAFPLLFSVYAEDRDDIKAGCPLTVPWALVAPHEAQAHRNHSQSLRRLAERGGLGPCELVAVLHDRPWRRMVPGAAREILTALVAEYEALL